MFFRHRPPHQATFDERLAAARKAGFSAAPQPDGKICLTRDGVAAVVENAAGSPRLASPAGVVVGGEISRLVDGGYQKFLDTPSGKRLAATAEHLRAVHHFQEDLRQALGLESLYNESLGTVSQLYLYDRVEDRDRGVPRRPWES